MGNTLKLVPGPAPTRCLPRLEHGRPPLQHPKINLSRKLRLANSAASTSGRSGRRPGSSAGRLGVEGRLTQRRLEYLAVRVAGQRLVAHGDELGDLEVGEV